jgi:hypothetical protein
MTRKAIYLPRNFASSISYAMYYPIAYVCDVIHLMRIK